MDRELGEIINYAISGYKRGVAVNQIFTVTPTDANGYMAAFVVKAIEHYRPEFKGEQPPAQSEQDREMTAAQIEQGWRDTFSTGNPFCPCDLKSFTKAVRWHERALAEKGERHA